MVDSFPENRSQREYAGTTSQGTVYSSLNTRSGANRSLNHKRSRDGNYYHGGPWLMYKVTKAHSGRSITAYRRTGTYEYTGRFYILNTNFVNPNVIGDAASQEQSTRNYGARAFDALKPDNPDFTASSSLYELKEVFSPLKDRAKDKFRKSIGMRDRLIKEKHWSKHAANEYVKYWFGWLPLANDVVNFTEAFQGRKKRFDQLLRDEGKGVRRGRRFDSDKGVPTTAFSDSSTSYNSGVQPLLHTYCYKDGRSSTTTKTTISSSTWCKGKSKYLLPPGPRDDVWNRVLLNRILGWRSGNFTFEDIYNVVPWSWLVDYFSGVGDFITAISPGIADRVWFDYAYVMRTHECVYDQTRSQYVITDNKNGPSQKVDCSLVGTVSRKTRVAASPFGFGLETPSLKQMSILGALGYSKLPDLS